jgi:UDP-2,4-diacetamido-2,4,6-trideoxy-beta-L-altropyranose hydrolase
LIVVFRTTCTESTGLGHFRRCLTLAEEAAADATTDAAPIFLLTADERGRELASTSAFTTEFVDAELAATLEAVDRVGADALIADDYALTSAHIAALHARVDRMLALDDLSDRALDVDAVLNANPAAGELAYDVPAGCLRLFGASYALLRREFRDVPRRQATATIERVLVTLGGSNPGGRTADVAQLMLQLLPDARVEVVAGPLFQGELPDDARLVVHRSPRDMVQLMMRADLAIAAGGQTTYELAACGVPTVALCVADNQRANLAALAAVPTLRLASDQDLVDVVVALAADRDARQQLVECGQSLLDGRGAERAWRALSDRWSRA